MPVDLTQKLLEKLHSQKIREAQDISDGRQRGLVLRSAPTGLTWWLRTKVGGRPRRVLLGSFPQLSIAAARSLVSDASDALRRGDDVDDQWVAAQRVSAGIDEPPPLPPEPEKPAQWTWEEAREAYLTSLDGQVRPKTVAGYRQFLTHPSLAPLAGRKVSSITRQDLAVLVAGVHLAGNETQAKNMADALRPMWTYLGTDAVRGRSGVEEGVMVRLKAPRRSRVSKGKRKERTPSVAEVAKVVAYARCGVLNPIMASAIEITMLTAQRRYSVVQAKRSCVLQEDGFNIWRLPLEDLKTGESRIGAHGEEIPDHELALPPATWSAFERALDLPAIDDWLLPQARPQKAGGPMKHINESSLTHAVKELPGVDFSPHDVRRTFTTTLRRLRFPRGAASLILDHSEGRADDTTARHYDRYRELAEKLELLQAWSDAVEAEVAKVEVDTEALREHLREVRAKRTKKAKKKAGPVGKKAALVSEAA